MYKGSRGQKPQQGSAVFIPWLWFTPLMNSWFTPLMHYESSRNYPSMNYHYILFSLVEMHLGFYLKWGNETIDE